MKYLIAWVLGTTVLLTTLDYRQRLASLEEQALSYTEMAAYFGASSLAFSDDDDLRDLLANLCQYTDIAAAGVIRKSDHLGLIAYTEPGTPSTRFPIEWNTQEGPMRAGISDGVLTTTTEMRFLGELEGTLYLKIDLTPLRRQTALRFGIMLVAGLLCSIPLLASSADFHRSFILSLSESNSEGLP